MCAFDAVDAAYAVSATENVVKSVPKLCRLYKSPLRIMHPEGLLKTK